MMRKSVMLIQRFRLTLISSMIAAAVLAYAVSDGVSAWDIVRGGAPLVLMLLIVWCTEKFPDNTTDSGGS